jgi:subtilisin family serine protease
MLNGKVDEEACFSLAGTVSGGQYVSACTNGANQQVGVGSSGNFGVFNSNAYRNHGTHVASTAAGSIVTFGTTFSGVARNAHLVTVNVASRNTNGVSSEGGIFDGSMLLGLNWVYQQKLNGRNIAAVNMSISNNQSWSGVCDSIYPSFVNIVAALYDLGVTTVVISGNYGYVGGMGFPACLSNVVSVGSSNKADTTISSFANRAARTTIAVLKSNYPSASPGEIRTALIKGTQKWFAYLGPDTYSNCGPICYLPRLDVGYANANFSILTFGGGL